MTISAVLAADPLDLTPARRPAPACSTLPDIAPGQLWLIEAPAAPDGFPAALQRTIDGAHVVIYDRALGAAVARSLPLGSYGEPAPEGDGGDDRAAARAVGFARDGWSVARLVPARPAQRERLARVRRLIDDLAATRNPRDVNVTVVGELPDGVCEPTETRLDRLDLVVVTYPREARLTIVVDGIGSGAARLFAVAGNGLAG